MSISWMELKDARALAGMTQADLASAVGVHQKTIVNWESSGVPPRSEYKVQRVLGDELRYLVESSDDSVVGIQVFEEWRTAREGLRNVAQSHPPHDNFNEVVSTDLRTARAALRPSDLGFDQTANGALSEQLRSFTSRELLCELIRRDELSRRSDDINVGGPVETVDLRMQRDYARVADERFDDDDSGEDYDGI